MKPSHAQNDNLIDHTCQVWQPRLGRNLSREDARQIIEDVTGFFNVLTEWAGSSSPANDNSVPRPPPAVALETRAPRRLPSTRKGGAS